MTLRCTKQARTLRSTRFGGLVSDLYGKLFTLNSTQSAFPKLVSTTKKVEPGVHRAVTCSGYLGLSLRKGLGYHRLRQERAGL